VAIHRTDAGLPVFTGDPADLAPEERAFLEGAAAWGATEGAYAAMHRTKPQTAAFGLTDSPVGLAAWIVEKLRAWSDCDGDIEQRFTKDEILTNVTLYWLTETIGSSMRMYRANAAIPLAQHSRRVEVPSGFSLFPGDIVRPPRAWLDRTANAVRVTEPARGGHFAAFEEPELYAEELRAFFRPTGRWRAKGVKRHERSDNPSRRLRRARRIASGSFRASAREQRHVGFSGLHRDETRRRSAFAPHRLHADGPSTRVQPASEPSSVRTRGRTSTVRGVSVRDGRRSRASGVPSQGDPPRREARAVPARNRALPKQRR